MEPQSGRSCTYRRLNGDPQKMMGIQVIERGDSLQVINISVAIVKRGTEPGVEGADA